MKYRQHDRYVSGCSCHNCLAHKKRREFWYGLIIVAILLFILIIA